MPRGRKLVKVVEVEECMLGTAAEEFYRHTVVKGLAEATIKSYKMYVGLFVRWYGSEKTLNSITTKVLDDFLYYKKTERNNSHMNHLKVFFNFCIGQIHGGDNCSHPKSGKEREGTIFNRGIKVSA